MELANTIYRTTRDFPGRSWSPLKILFLFSVCFSTMSDAVNGHDVCRVINEEKEAIVTNAEAVAGHSSEFFNSGGSWVYGKLLGF